MINNRIIVNTKTFLLEPMEQKPITGYFQFIKKEYPYLWKDIHSFKTQIFIGKPTSAFLHYTTTIIDRKFAAIFTVPYICIENIE